MDKNRIAEWILALVFAPDRAQAAVGDFAEDATKRGDLWFWCCIFRATIARVWNDLTEKPYFLAGLAARACMLCLVATIGYLFVFMLLMSPALAIAVRLAHRSSAQGLGQAIPVALMLLTGAAAALAGAFQTGRWMGRRAQNRQMAACVALCLMQQLVSSAMELAIRQWESPTQRASFSAVGPGVLVLCLLVYFSLFAGAAQTRSERRGSVAK